ERQQYGSEPRTERAPASGVSGGAPHRLLRSLALAPCAARIRIGELLLRLGEPLFDRLPVDDVPPGVDVVGPPVLVAPVVGVFPAVDAEERGVPSNRRRVWVGRLLGVQLAVAADHQPRPAAAELAQRVLLHLRLELVEAAEGRVDRAGKVTRRLPTAAGPHD